MRLLHCIVGSALVLTAVSASAQSYPSNPIRVMVPFPPGGSTDIVARILAQKLEKPLGQPLVVENRGGAGGTIGAAVGAKAAPDGYLLTFGSTSTHVVAPSVYPKLEYDPVKDFAPIRLVAVRPYLLAVNPKVEAKNVKELVALMKQQPGKMNYASAGIASAKRPEPRSASLAPPTRAVAVP